MQHRKQEHRETISQCRNDGNCKFANCWYLHSEEHEKLKEIDKQNKNESMLEKLFTMMEKITERMVQIENHF